MKKMTKKDYFNKLLTYEVVAIDSEMTDFIKHELELLDKKATHTKLTPIQEDNEKLKVEIINYLSSLDAENPSVTISQLQKVETFYLRSNQKLSAIMKLLILEGKVERHEIKKVAYFSIN